MDWLARMPTVESNPAVDDGHCWPPPGSQPCITPNDSPQTSDHLPKEPKDDLPRSPAWNLSTGRGGSHACCGRILPIGGLFRQLSHECAPTPFPRWTACLQKWRAGLCSGPSFRRSQSNQWQDTGRGRTQTKPI